MRLWPTANSQALTTTLRLARQQKIESKRHRSGDNALWQAWEKRIFQLTCPSWTMDYICFSTCSWICAHHRALRVSSRGTQGVLNFSSSLQKRICTQEPLRRSLQKPCPAQRGMMLLFRLRACLPYATYTCFQKQFTGSGLRAQGTNPEENLKKPYAQDAPRIHESTPGKHPPPACVPGFPPANSAFRGATAATARALGWD